MSTNGSTPPDHDDKKIVKFPTLADRDRMRKEEEERRRREYRTRQKAQKAANSEPFLNVGNIPPFTKILVLTLLAINVPFLLLSGMGVTMFGYDLKLLTYTLFGFIPGMYTGAFEWSWTGLITPITHAFVHGGWMHLGFNVVMGLALTMFFEKLFSARTAALFFAACTIGGAAIYFLLAPFSITPVVGASGGISGLFGAVLYIMISQNASPPITQRLGKYGPWPVIVIWGLIIVVPGMLMGSSLAWQAHLGGYVTGIVLFTAMRKGYIKL